MVMTLTEAVTARESMGSEQARMTYLRHGAREPLWGVKFGDLRPLAKRIGRNHALARQLWATGNADARLLGAADGRCPAYLDQGRQPTVSCSLLFSLPSQAPVTTRSPLTVKLSLKSKSDTVQSLFASEPAKSPSSKPPSLTSWKLSTGATRV